MVFVPYVLDSNNVRIIVDIHPMLMSEAEQTNQIPLWQTSWTSDYLLDDRFEKYAVVREDELIALGAYEVQDASLIVHIVYLEAHPESNPTITKADRKYRGIGRLLLAYSIKLSVDHGFGGDVVLEAKTSELRDHYMRDFGAVKLPSFSGAPRLLIADEAAKRIFFSYLE